MIRDSMKEKELPSFSEKDFKFDFDFKFENNVKGRKKNKN